MRRLAQSTAYTVMLKLFLSSDHVSAATGKTVAITISKAGGAFGNPNAGASNATEVANGWYKFALDTTDTNTLGDLVVRGTATSCDDAEQVCQVVSATTGGATNLDAAVSAVKAKTDSLTFTVAGMVDSNVVDWKGATAPAMTGDAYARLGAPAGVSVSADVAAVKTDTAAIKTKTDFLPSATAGSAGGVFIAGTNAATTVTTAFTTTFTGNLTGSVGSVTGNVGGSVGSVSGLTASNLDVAVSTRLAASSYTAPPSASTIAQAVWDVLTSALATVGSIGKLLVTNIDAAISSRSTYAGGDTSGTTTLLSRLTSTRAGLLDHLDADISSRMATFSYTAPLDAAGTRAAVGLASANLDTQLATLSTSAEITSLQSHGDSAWATATGFSTLDATAVENAVWDAAAASHVTSGSFGGEVNDTASAAGTIEGRIGTPAFGDLAGDIAHAQGVIDGIDGVTSTLVMTAGKLWVLDESGNPLPHTSDISTIETAIGALPAASDNANAVLAATYEGSETVQDHLRLARSALYGKANGLAGTSVHYRDAADSKNRISATVDADGNRSAVTTDAT